MNYGMSEFEIFVYVVVLDRKHSVLKEMLWYAHKIITSLWTCKVNGQELWCWYIHLAYDMNLWQ